MRNTLRRLLLTLLTAFLLPALLGGCAPTKEKTQALAAGDFDTTAAITYGEITGEMVCSRAAGETTLRLTEPEKLAGMTFVFRDDLVVIEYLGLTFELDPESLPAQAASGMMVTAINAACEPYGVELAVEGDVLILSGESGAGAFLLRLDRETGNYLSLDIPDAQLSAEFHGFTFSDLTP